MPDFEPYACKLCGGDFKAYPDAEAVENGYCSPSYQTADNGLN